ncbi:MAG: 4Fe-4S single cluster domain protein [Bacteriophage sp.]|nr:MAG: 4Fe-4S single cluster domain protein [Bacteriophage sp.]
MLRVHYIDDNDMINTDSMALTIYFQGCNLKCEGCHNPSLQPFTGGIEYTPIRLLYELDTDYDLSQYDTVCLLGGEPLLQHKSSLIDLIYYLYKIGKKVWLYTGFEYDKVPSFVKDWCYCVKAGAYDPVNYPPIEGAKLASANQAYYYKDGRIVK